MNRLRCQAANHKKNGIFSICLHIDCKQKRFCCQECELDLHKDHKTQIITIRQFNDFFQNQTYQQEKFPQFFNQEQNCKAYNLQGFLNKFENKQIGIDYLNEFIDEILQYMEVDDNLLKKKKQPALNFINYRQISNYVGSNVRTTIQSEQIPSHEKILIYSKDPIELIVNLDKVQQVIISQDGNLIAYISKYTTIKVRSIQTNQELYSIQNDSKVQYIQLSTNNQYLASLDSESNIKFYNLNSTRNVRQFRIKIQQQNCGKMLILSRNNQFLLSQTNFQQRVSIWSVIGRKKIRQIKVDEDSNIDMLAISPENKCISCIGSFRSQINIWDFQTAKMLIQQYSTHKNGCAICQSDDSQIFVSSGQQGLIRTWMLNKQNQFILTNQIKDANSQINQVILTADEQYILSLCSTEGSIMIHEQESGKLVQKLDFIANLNSLAASIAISNDMKTLVCTNDTPIIRVWTRD